MKCINPISYKLIIMKKLFIVGGSGLLGSNFINQSKKKYNIYAHENRKKISITGIKKVKINITDINKLKNFIKKENIEIIMNFVGLTSIEKCESNKEEARICHIEIPKKLKIISKIFDIKFLHVSTDHLFSGNFKGKYSEKSYCNPVNYYGKTKLIGEKKISDYKKTLILRTNFFGSLNKKNNSFANKIINRLRAKKKVYLWEDIYFTPVFLIDLIKIINLLITKNICGTYNIASNNKISKYEFGVKLSKKFNLNHNDLISYKFNKNNFIKRPKNMSLDNSKILKKLKFSKKTFDLDKQILRFKKYYLKINEFK